MKTTKKEMFAIVKEIVANVTDEKFTIGEKEVSKEELKEFVANEIKNLEKKRTSSKPTEKQLANEKLKETILQVLTEVGERMTISEMLKDSRLSEYSNQKISSLLTQLKKAEKVVNVHEKKVSYFSVAE